MTYEERIRQFMLFAVLSIGAEAFLIRRLYDICGKVVGRLSTSDNKDFCKVIQWKESYSGLSGTDS